MKSIETKNRNLNAYLNLLILFIAVLTFSGLSAQTYPIENGDITVCTGIFADDGNSTVGAGGPYTVTGNYTFTICPETPGDVISVSFVAFALYVSPNPNNSDYLEIYDGDTDQAPSLGNYTGTSLQGLPVTGTVDNISGCLTFVFHPSTIGNASGAFPGWEAMIECTTPCANPTSASEIVDPVPQGISQSIGICLNAPVTFGDNGSFPASGFNIQYYVWNYDDGTIDTLTGPQNAVHSYTEPGEYLASLSVIDNNGCRSLNTDPLQVLVSTIPIFNTDFESPVCVGTNAQIDGAPVQSVTWTALPPQVVAGTTYLADGAGFAYTTCLTFDFFEPGATLDNCSDLLDVFVNMEHSYLGDLGMSITCPDGTLVNLLDYTSNTGGATYLGEAVDEYNLGPDPNSVDTAGVGYDYGWSPTSTNGFIYDAANNTPTSYTNNAGGVETNHNIANPGFYQSNEDMCSLVGCPLNGDWCFNVTDHLASDNGYIFEWGIDFNPALFPDVTTFTPVIGLQADSTYWTGPNVVNTSADGNLIQTQYDSPGSYDYTFYATNSFGCTFDTTITVEVIEGPDITAGPDKTFCTDPVILDAGLANVAAECGGDAGNFEYCYQDGVNLSETYCPDNPGDGITFMELFINSGSTQNWSDEFYVYDGEDTSAPILAGPLYGDLSGMSFVATNPSGCITWQITPDTWGNSCESGDQDPLNVSVSCNGGSGLIWSWSPATGLSNPNVQNPTAQVEQSTTYTVSAYPIGFPGCVITDQVTVSPDQLSDPGLDTDTTLCYNSPLSNLTDYLEGNPALGGTWTDDSNVEISAQFNPTTYPDGGSFTYHYTVTNGTCEGNSTLNLTILPFTNSTCCQTNAHAGPDATPCDLVYQLQADNPLGIGTWTGPANVTFSNIHDPHAIATCTSPGGDMTLTFTDNNGTLCFATDDITVHFADPLSLIVIPQDAICNNQCNGTAVVIADGGTTTSGIYTYDWHENGKPGLIPQTRDSLCSGLFSVKIYDSLGCADSTTFQINQPEAQDLFVTQTPPLCADSCDGKILIQSGGAVDYSFDAGNSYQASNEGNVCAGEHNVIARNAKGCEVNQTVNIINPEKYVANFNINPLPTTTKNTTITFQDVSRPGPVVKSEYTFGDNPVIGQGDSRISTFVFPKDTAGVYPVELISTNVNGCIDTLIQNVIIKNDLLWYIPNSFSPNGDGINDIWRPVSKTLDISDYELTIVDRWGKVLFHTRDFTQGWNGSNQNDGFFVDAGVYTYLIKVTSETTEEKVKFTGFITVIR